MGYGDLPDTQKMTEAEELRMAVWSSKLIRMIEIASRKMQDPKIVAGMLGAIQQIKLFSLTHAPAHPDHPNKDFDIALDSMRTVGRAVNLDEDDAEAVRAELISARKQIVEMERQIGRLRLENSKLKSAPRPSAPQESLQNITKTQSESRPISAPRSTYVRSNKGPTMRERALEMYSREDRIFSVSEIAEALGSTPASVNSTIALARSKGDPRAVPSVARLEKRKTGARSDGPPKARQVIKEGTEDILNLFAQDSPFLTRDEICQRLTISRKTFAQTLFWATKREDSRATPTEFRLLKENEPKPIREKPSKPERLRIEKGPKPKQDSKIDQRLEAILDAYADDNPVLSVESIARLNKVTQVTIYNYIKRGKERGDPRAEPSFARLLKYPKMRRSKTEVKPRYTDEDRGIKKFVAAPELIAASKRLRKQEARQAS